MSLQTKTIKERRLAQLRNTKVYISYMGFPGMKGKHYFPTPPHNKPEFIEKLVCDYYGKNTCEIRTNSRHASVVKCRQIIMYLMRKYTNMSVVELGKMFNRHHSIVIHSVDKVKNYILYNEPFRTEMEHFENILN